MRVILAAGLLSCSLVAGGCATIISGSSQSLTVNSNVEGADVYLNEQPLGKTPLIVTVKRGQVGTLSVRKDGYTPYQIAINKKINGVFWVNILSGGTFGSSTDYSTGAMYEYEPASYFASIQPVGQSAPSAESWRRQEGLRAFVLLNNEALVADLAAGQGEYVDVLLQAFAVPPERRHEAIERWRADYAASETAVEFAATIADSLPRES